MPNHRSSTLALTREFEVRRQQFNYEDLTRHSLAVLGFEHGGRALAESVVAKGLPAVGFELNGTPAIESALSEVPVSTDFNDLRRADIFCICVQSSVSDEPDNLTPLIEAVRTVAAALRPGSMVLMQTPLKPGVSEEVIIPLLEYESDLSVERDFFYVYCPERGLGNDTEGTSSRVIGGAGPLSLERGINVYDAILEVPLTPMASVREAEAVKMVENAYRDVSSALANEFAMAFDRAGIDAMNVLTAASTKFPPVTPTCGVGGHSKTGDPYALIQFGQRHGFTHHILMAARETNNYMPYYTVQLLKEALYFNEWNIHDTHITVLGLSHTANEGGLQDSPALDICDLLLKEGAPVRTFDPYIHELSTDHTLESALEGAKAIIIATDHHAFKLLTPALLETHGVEIVIDGRNVLDKLSFDNSPITYRGIGR